VQPYAQQQPVATGQMSPATGLTSAQRFWYVVQCIALGAGYFKKLSTAKALSEIPQFQTAAHRR
jgi:hypothetical protein